VQTGSSQCPVSNPLDSRKNHDDINHPVKKKDVVPVNNFARDGPEKVADKHLIHMGKICNVFVIFITSYQI